MNHRLGKRGEYENMNRQENRYKEAKARKSAFCHAGQQCQGFLGGRGIGLNKGGSKKTVSGRWVATAEVAGAFEAGPLAFGAALMGTTLAGWATAWTGLLILGGEAWLGVCKRETDTVGASGDLKREADQTSWFTRPIRLYAPVAWIAWSPEGPGKLGEVAGLGSQGDVEEARSGTAGGAAAGKAGLNCLPNRPPGGGAAGGGAVGAVGMGAEGGTSRLPHLPQVSSSELD